MALDPPEFFAILTTFCRIFAKNHELLVPYCALGVPADASTVVSWSILLLASLLLQVSHLLLLLWCSYCLCCYWSPSPAVASFTVFASISAFDCAHTGLAVLLLLTFLLLLAFLLLWSVIILLSSLMMLVLGLLLLLMSLLLFASRLWQTFLLLLVSFKLLRVSCCWSLWYCLRSWCNQWWCWRFCCSFRTCCCWRSCCYWLSCCWRHSWCC